MSAYSTKTITRQEAEEMLNKIMYKRIHRGFGSNRELAEELNNYAYAEADTDILGVLYNFEVID